MRVDRNSLRFVFDDQRLNVHAYPAGSMGAAIGRLIHVGFNVTHGYQDGSVRMSRQHADGRHTFCFVKQSGRVGPMLTSLDVRQRIAHLA